MGDVVLAILTKTIIVVFFFDFGRILAIISSNIFSLLFHLVLWNSNYMCA